MLFESLKLFYQVFSFLSFQKKCIKKKQDYKIKNRSRSSKTKPRPKMSQLEQDLDHD